MQLAKIFTDNMVLCANAPIRIFGEGKGEVKILFLGKEYQTRAQNEKWCVELDSAPYGGPYEMEISLNGERKILRNVMLGEVYLCAGQSNMQFMVEEEWEKDTVQDNPMVRYFLSDRLENYDGLHSADGWVQAERPNIHKISALGFYVADRIAREKKIAVGIVGCFQGASVIRSWIPPKAMQADFYVPIELRHEDSREPLFASWNADGACYNYTFLPIVPYTFTRVLWYQGESNTTVEEGKSYDKALQALISVWREDLKNPSLPFTVIQIADLDDRRDEGWYAIQAAQERMRTAVGVTVVQSKDVCESDTIHPVQKRALANRIADKILEA